MVVDRPQTAAIYNVSSFAAHFCVPNMIDERIQNVGQESNSWCHHHHDGRSLPIPQSLSRNFLQHAGASGAKIRLPTLKLRATSLGATSSLLCKEFLVPLPTVAPSSTSFHTWLLGSSTLSRIWDQSPSATYTAASLLARFS